MTDDVCVRRLIPFSLSLAVWLSPGVTLQAQELSFQEPLRVLVQAPPAQLVSLSGTPEISSPSPFSVQQFKTVPLGAGQSVVWLRWRRTPDTEFVWTAQTPPHSAARATSTLTIVP